jgi:hypothetical protein
MGRAMRRPASLAAMAALIPLALPGPVAAADPVTFGTPTASSSFGESIEFRQPAEFSGGPNQVEFLLRTPGSTAPTVDDQQTTGRGPVDLGQTIDLTERHIVPNTTLIAQWRVTDPDGRVWLSPEISETYSDDRVDWQTLEGDVVRVHWYEGGDDFGRRALQIGDGAVAETSQLLGVTETKPIDFFIYADQDKFYDALGPATRENVGGEAHADIRTMFALITPGEINDDWVNIVVPHELTHLVFDTATDNPYHDPPHWLNEGLAVYLSEGLTSGDRSLVENAAKDSTLMPLEGLAGAFPTTRDRFFLAYAESVSAVDDIVADHGRDALIDLIRSYADGVSDDEAFTSALGVDVADFEQAWLDGLGAAVPIRHGPQAAPVGPLPEGWSGAAPNATNQPCPSGAPPGSSPGPNTPIDEPPGSTPGGPNPALAVGLVAIVVAIAAIAFVAFRRTRRPAPAGSAAAVAWTEPRDPEYDPNAGFSLPGAQPQAPERDATERDAAERHAGPAAAGLADTPAPNPGAWAPSPDASTPTPDATDEALPPAPPEP